VSLTDGERERERERGGTTMGERGRVKRQGGDWECAQKEGAGTWAEVLEVRASVSALRLFCLWFRV